MKDGTAGFLAIEIKYSFLKDKEGNWMEFLYTIVPTAAEKIEDQIKSVEQAEADLFKKFSIDPDTIAVKRIYPGAGTLEPDAHIRRYF